MILKTPRDCSGHCSLVGWVSSYAPRGHLTRAHARIEGSIPIGGVQEAANCVFHTPINVFLSFFLKFNKNIFKKKTSHDSTWLPCFAVNV